MYKHLFRTVLGVVGIFVMISLGVVNATDVTITYNLSGGYRVESGTTESQSVQFTTDANGMVGTTNRKTPSKGESCEENGVMKKCMFDGWYLENGARWTGYADSDMTVYAKRLPFEDLVITTGDFSFTIMDRNLGATASGTGCSDSDTSTCGYHFQWGNNYGFKPYQNNNSIFSNGEKGNSVSATDREGHTSTYYNGIWRTINPWNNNAQNDDNLWGGSQTSNSDEYRQGPCPEGYHVPDTLEWKAVGMLLNASRNGYTVRDTLNLPFAGYRSYYENEINVLNMGSNAYYWSSTSTYSNYYAHNLSFYSAYIGWQNDSNRSFAYTVRCFKNSSPKILTFSIGNEVLATKEVKWWEPVILSDAPDVPERENAEFVGWFLGSSEEVFKFGPSTYISEDTMIMAKYRCNVGYLENENGTACEKIRVEFDANGGSFGDENVKVIEASLEYNPESTIKYSHTPNIDDEGNKMSDYAYGLNLNDVVAITGARNLHVKINREFDFYPGSSRNEPYGYVSMWTGSHPNYTTENYLSMPLANKLSGLGSNGIEYNVDGDTVTFACRTDTDDPYYMMLDKYGYYAVIEGTGSYVAYPDGVFDDILPSREGYKFKGWYLSDGTEFNTGNVSTGEVIKVYADWEKIRVEFNANGGKFSDNDNIFSIIKSKQIFGEKTGALHTANLDDNDNYTNEFNGQTINGYTTYLSTYTSGGITTYPISSPSIVYFEEENVEKLDVSIKYGGSPYCTPGYIIVWTGDHRQFDANYNPGNTGLAVLYIADFPSFGENREKSVEIEGDSFTIYQNGGCPSYGFFANISRTQIVDLIYEEGAFDNIPEPTREGHKFVGWYLSDDTEFNTGNVSTGEITKVYAKRECADGYENKGGECVKKSSGSSGGGGGGGGGGGSSSSSSTGSNTPNQQSGTGTNNSTGTQNDQITTGTNINEPEGTGNNAEIQTGSQIDSNTGSIVSSGTNINNPDTETPNDSTTSPQNDDKSYKTYSTEFQQAYEFAKGNGITTMPTIQKANMEGKLTRIAMAKMLSQYAMNVLGQKPANIVTPKFNDVTDKMNTDYDDGVTLAYQLGIMGQNMPNNNFRPNDEVTRAEFATALSRMAYGTSDGEYKGTGKYYIHHMEKLVKEGIITKDDPKMKELRGYVMIMLMRSAK